MSSLPSPPPSPLEFKRHRRSDSFALMQTIIKEREKEEHREEEIKFLRLSCPPPVRNNAITTSNSTTLLQKNKVQVVPHKSLSTTVKFTTEPPKVYHYI